MIQKKKKKRKKKNYGTRNSMHLIDMAKTKPEIK